MNEFLASRWSGEAPLETVFWRDMITVGTVINVIATGISMAFFASGAPAWLGMLVFFSPLPWNLLLFVAVWKASAGAEESAWMFQAGAVLWLVAMTLL
jgi:hypothetical protein